MLTRYDPFREMLAIRNTMERLLDSAVTGTSTLQPATLGLALDIAESENEYVVKASLPGINLNDLEITYANNTLTIKGEVREEQELEEARYHLRERSYGSFARSITPFPPGSSPIRSRPITRPACSHSACRRPRKSSRRKSPSKLATAKR